MISMMNSNIGASSLPPPPVFKPTIIQMKGSPSLSARSDTSITNGTTITGEKNESAPFQTSTNILTTLTISPELNAKQSTNTMAVPMATTTTNGNGTKKSSENSPQLLSSSSTSSTTTTTRKRRKSSLAIDQEEASKKRKELKAAHSIIEKKRRTKMNREFEALKYLVPACRTCILQSMLQPTVPTSAAAPEQNNTTRSNSVSSDNNDNSSQMHKLTILQSTVEYISYLHHIIQLQNENLLKNDPSYNIQNDISFTDFELNLDTYRDIDSEYDFNLLFKELMANGGKPVRLEDVNNELKMASHQQQQQQQMSRSLSLPSSQLPSPFMTPNFIDSNHLASLNKYKIDPYLQQQQPQQQQLQQQNGFQLPLPMMSTNKNKKANKTDSSSPLMTSMSQSQPQQTSTTTITTTNTNIPKSSILESNNNDQTTNDIVSISDNLEASKVLLSIKDDNNHNKKNSISNLLN